METILAVAIGATVLGFGTVILGRKHKSLVTIGLALVSIGGAGLGYSVVEALPEVASEQSAEK